jgi:hypothetical protein
MVLVTPRILLLLEGQVTAESMLLMAASIDDKTLMSNYFPQYKPVRVISQELNRLMGPQSSRLDNWISNGNTYVIKRLKKPTHIRFHTKSSVILPQNVLSDTINIDSSRVHECS